MSKKQLLHDNWIVQPALKSFVPEDVKISSEGIEAQVPGTVHTDLLNNGLIADPFYADNEKNLHWIDTIDWIYKSKFDFPSKFKVEKPVHIVFEGLDTIADIYLNGEKIGNTKNMFKCYQFEISTKIKKKQNRLQIRFRSARQYGLKNKSAIHQFPTARHPERVFIRKAQYSFGWDWSPAYPTTGIWRPVYLVQHEKAWIDSAGFSTLSINSKRAKTRISVKLSGNITPGFKIIMTLSDTKQTYKIEKILISEKSVQFDWDIRNPELWWPNGLGNPHLYHLEINLTDEEGKCLDCWQRRVGIRTIILQREDRGKNTFRFLVNSKAVFIKGANWIPGDSFLPRITENQYDHLLTLARDAHMNMIRVWGGGIYENDIFYDLCDRLGLMVWQDFMFACAAYPERKDFLKEVMEEVEQNINRLQYHPAIAIWCGNNENEWIWYRDGCGKIYKMPGYSIFHKHIPELLKQLDPVRPYWPTTPFGNEDDPNDPASGNRHVWDIWSQWVDYTEISKDKSHFVTEFGFQSPANYSTLSDVIPKSEMNPHSRQFEFHNKQHEGAERLIRFLAGHLPIQTRIKDYIYLTQLNQGLALKCCLEHWRLRWPETNGNIIWQLNDCWPVTSWSLIDSKGLPKLAYYFVKRAFSPQLIAFQYEKEQINLVISNQSAEIFSGYAELYQISSENGRILNSKTISVEVKSQAIKNIMQMAGTALIEDGKQILVARLLNVSRKQLHINYFHGSRWKFVKLNKSEINLDYANNRIELTSPSCAFFVTLQHPNLIFADNGIILIPGEKFTMSVIGGTLSAEQIKNIKVNTLNHYLA